MKIISGGLFAKEGINVFCDWCHCKYLIEDKKDFNFEIYYGSTKNPVVQYNVKCPECGREFRIGYDSYHHLMFKRSDWKERYEVSVEEAIKLGAYDYKKDLEK